MRKPKKLLNNPEVVAAEMFEGFMAASSNHLERVGNLTAAVRKDTAPCKVKILTGGGAGHEPMYAGYVGQGMADGVATGDVFAAPSPDVILQTAMALKPEDGLIFIYGNYAGDNMNFDIASELLEDEGIRCHTIRINDDVISAGPDLAHERRGIAGALYSLKISGAAAEQGQGFQQVIDVTERALSNTASIGVALGPCAIPRNQSFNFDIADDEIEIGMGLHGEPGVGKSKLTSADQTVEQIMDRLVGALELKEDDEVCVLVNNLGASTQMELLVAHRAVDQYLQERGICIHDVLIGEYCTSLEMAGYSISLLKLDDELKALYDASCQSFALRK